VSRLGVIPKGKSGKWRLIVGLSLPEGKSVNDRIEHKLCSMNYVTVNGAVEVIWQAGRGAFLAKVDIQQALRMVPVPQEDCLLLGMEWEGSSFVDAALPFGLCSAPKIFSAIVDALEWQVQKESTLYYLDDFFAGCQVRGVSPRGHAEAAHDFSETQCASGTREAGGALDFSEVLRNRVEHSDHDYASSCRASGRVAAGGGQLAGQRVLHKEAVRIASGEASARVQSSQARTHVHETYVRVTGRN